jgi:3-oxoacyl-[acyl-carrier-protein] synthase III
MFHLSGVGHFLPSTALSTVELAHQHEQDADRLLVAPGIVSRYYAREETQVDMAAEAARRALESAGVTIEEIDLVISACAVSYQPIPTLSPLIAKELGAADGAFEAMDINTTCLSFVSALDLAHTLLQSGRNKSILIVSSEMSSRGLDWVNDPETAALFGDGAAAVVLQAGSSRIAASRFRSYPSAWDACQLASGGTRHDLWVDREAFDQGSTFRMKGKDLFRISLLHFPKFVESLLQDAGWGLDDIDLIIPHQASPHALRHMSKVCGFDPHKVVDIMADHGNMISASIPLALSYAVSDGRITPGAKVLMLGTSAGVSFGGVALELDGVK